MCFGVTPPHQLTVILPEPREAVTEVGGLKTVLVGVGVGVAETEGVGPELAEGVGVGVGEDPAGCADVAGLAGMAG